jgi:tRNA-binding EMAP/Myf-like protein
VKDPSQELQALDLVVGRVVAAAEHPGSRAPSLLLTVDLGPRGERRASLLSPSYEPRELVGRQVVCAVGDEDAVVLGAHSHAAGLVLLAPDREVEDGTAVA